MRAAAEAVIELLARADREGGRLLVVEGAAGHVVAPGLLQRDARSDHVDDIDPREQLVDEVLWDLARHGTGIITCGRRCPTPFPDPTPCAPARSRRAFFRSGSGNARRGVRTGATTADSSPRERAERRAGRRTSRGQRARSRRGRSRCGAEAFRPIAGVARATSAGPGATPPVPRRSAPGSPRGGEPSVAPPDERREVRGSVPHPGRSTDEEPVEAHESGASERRPARDGPSYSTVIVIFSETIGGSWGTCR